MKFKLIFLLYAPIIVFFSCQKKEIFSIRSEKDMGPMTQKVITGDFDEIEVSTAISAEIVKGDEEKVIVSAPKNILEEVEAEIKGGILTIRVKPGIRFKSMQGISAKIFAKDFKSIEANSAASINVKEKFLNEENNISVSSSGSIKGNFEANKMTIDASSAGNFSGKIWAIDLNSDASSSGSIMISGNAKKIIAGASSGGNISAKEFTADDGDLDVSSGGSITLGIKNSLTAEASSGGNIQYINLGNTSKINTSTSSGGSISAVK